MVDRLTRLIAIPSVDGTDAEIEVQHELAGWLRELDCDVDTWQIDLAEAASAPDAPGQEVVRSEAWGVVGTLPAAESGTPALVFCGHTDVVPPGDLALWDGDPFVPRLVGGAVHGRGACDMKGGVVASLAALAAVRAAGIRLVRPVALHGVVGEEDGGLGAWAAIRRGHLGDLCVIPEPTARAVVTANAGALTFCLEVTGRAAHAAMRDRGVSAVELFAVVHAGLLEFEAERQLGQLPAGHPLLPAVRGAVTDAGGGVPQELAIAAGSDLRQYAAAGVPTLHYGPGDLQLAHGSLERVPVAEVVTAARAFALLTLRSCGVR